MPFCFDMELTAFQLDCTTLILGLLLTGLLGVVLPFLESYVFFFFGGGGEGGDRLLLSFFDGVHFLVVYLEST